MNTAPDSNYGNLDPQKIIDTVELLKKRIGERFPDSGLFKVCQQLDLVAENMKRRAAWIGKPVLWLRSLNFIICISIIIFAIGSLWYFLTVTGDTTDNHSPADTLRQGGWMDLITIFEAGMNDLVLIGAAIFFFLSLETRYKRQRALKAIHELRTIAHVIDMHQLTKDPHRIAKNRKFDATTLSPKLELTPFQLRRYLDYCSEMLSLVGKIAAVYVQEFDDGVALASVSELETLTNGLTNKIWQKITILHTASANDEAPVIHTN